MIGATLDSGYSFNENKKGGNDRFRLYCSWVTQTSDLNGPEYSGTKGISIPRKELPQIND